METLQFPQHHFMFSSLKLHPQKLLILQTHCSNLTKSLCTSNSSSSSTLLNLKSLETETPHLARPPSKPKRTCRSKNANGAELKEFHAQLKQNWLASLSCHEVDVINGNGNAGSTCVVGIDPDLSGALAFLKTDHLGSSVQVFDTPHLKALVGTRTRRRLDARSIVELLRSLNAPVGTKAYLEQSIPFPQDGKQGWWSGGFGYGLWIGVLVSLGFSVVPVPSLLWKNEFELTGSCNTKDDSRRVASTLFPSMITSLKRKKDHGRAEALLIAAYGKGIRIKSASAKSPDCITEEFFS